LVPRPSSPTVQPYARDIVVQMAGGARQGTVDLAEAIAAGNWRKALAE
jgi:hypothetical protein